MDLKELEFWKDVAEIAKSIGTVVAILVGGVWTYYLFIRNRLKYPWVSIKIEPISLPLPKRRRLIHVRVVVKNVGKVILRSEAAELRLRLVLPLEDDLARDIESGYDAVFSGETQIEFPLIAQRDWSWGYKEFEIEPGEESELHADYVIDEGITAVEFYCFIKHSHKKDLGWSTTAIHDFEEIGRFKREN